ncbi:hypothetical protein Taro_050253 [Colocasia esculenta]|uniref:Uncharacterized protein n=1 Tax=Colocasia esculenta TaxID=4460 RepID=A0A843XDL5_COLES|nr:hypothetical protein [Colocasia esculenta]
MTVELGARRRSQVSLSVTTRPPGPPPETPKVAPPAMDSKTRKDQQELQQAEAKLLYKAVKRETPTTEYYKAAEIEKHLDHNPG